MNRTENFIAVLALAALAESNAGTIYGYVNLAAAALFFVAWFSQMRKEEKAND